MASAPIDQSAGATVLSPQRTDNLDQREAPRTIPARYITKSHLLTRDPTGQLGDGRRHRAWGAPNGPNAGGLFPEQETQETLIFVKNPGVAGVHETKAN